MNIHSVCSTSCQLIECVCVGIHIHTCMYTYCDLVINIYCCFFVVGVLQGAKGMLGESGDKGFKGMRGQTVNCLGLVHTHHQENELL